MNKDWIKKKSDAIANWLLLKVLDIKA